MVQPGSGETEFDFTIARGLSDGRLIGEVRDTLKLRSGERVEIDRNVLNSSLPEELRLSRSDAECLFTGLVLNGAATQTSTGKTFADYSFSVDLERACEVLDQQLVARAALEEAGVLERRPNAPAIELTGVFPSQIGERYIQDVRPLSEDIRQLFFDAKSTVRIANPYFDPSPAVVGDIASLANRGVETKVLTRETDTASRDLRSALNMMYDDIDPQNHHLLQVRDLYQWNEELGRQAYATHAKIAIADEEVCYLGSANLTETSLHSNFELGVLFRGDTVQAAIDAYDAVFEFSRQVDLPL